MQRMSLIGQPEMASGESRADTAIVVLGAGRGLTSVLRAVRGADENVTVIVGIAYDGERAADASDRVTGAGIGDLRRSLEALSGDEGALARAIRRPLTLEPLGRHPLGNLTLASAATALGDYAQASIWLGEQLGVKGTVLPATIEPVRRQIDLLEQAAPIESWPGAARPVKKVRFTGDRTRAPAAAIAAIGEARWVLLAPGALYRCVLSSAGVPDVTAALSRTPACVVWIANLEPDAETADMTAMDHLHILRLHGIRVDLALYDPAAALKLDAGELAKQGVKSISDTLRSGTASAAHDAERLGLVLASLIGSPTARAGGAAPSVGISPAG